MTSKIKVSQGSDRSFGERDVSARATHLKAAIGMVSMTTIERKIMSTKTTIKRIALVAAASLGFGVISAVPSSAAFIANTLSISTVQSGTGLTNISSDTTTAQTAQIRVRFTSSAADTATLSFIQDSGPSTIYLRIWGGISTETSYATVAPGVDTSASTGTALAKVYTDSDRANVVAPVRSDTAIITAAANSTTDALFTVYIDTKTTKSAGTYTFRAITQVHNVTGSSIAGLASEASTTFSFTVARAATSSLVASAATSTAVLSSDGSGTSDSIISASSTASSTPVGFLNVKLRNAASGVAARESVTVTTTLGNVGLLGGSQGKNVTLTYASDDSLTVAVFATGEVGTAVINVSTPSVSFTPKQVVYFGSMTGGSLVATQRATSIGVGSNTSAITVVAKDASGNINGSSTAILVYSSNTAVISETATACSYDTTNNRHNCTLTGVAAGTATISIGTAGKTIVSPDFTVTVTGNAPATVKLAFDKASYAPGEKGYIILSAQDSAGKSVASNTALTNLLAAGGITSTTGLTSVGGGISTTDSMTTSSVSPTLKWTTSTVGYTSAEPIYLIPFFAPITTGTITISATGGTLLPASGRVAVTASTTVNSDGAAALAAVTALASQVSAFITKINAQITTLTDLVMKIQKKVKA